MEATPFHKDFKLQGNSFNSVNEIIEFAKIISEDSSFFLQEWFNDRDFVEVKTSGSTGTPKCIQLQKKHMINSAITTGSFFNLPEKTTALLCMSPNYIAGKMMLVRALTLGWHIDVVEPSSNPLKYCIKMYDFSAMVPLQVNNSISYVHKIKKLIVGGGVVSNELLSKIQLVENEIFVTYGMTETITHIAVKKLNHCHSERVEESNYCCLPNVIVTKDSRGCLVINAPKVSKNNVITNDLIELISPTEFKWLGRFDTVINSGGIKLIPEQIEAKLSKIISRRFFVAGIPDVLLGEKLILVIEGENNLNRDQFFIGLKNLQNLLKYEIPKDIYFLKEFIATETKKVNRLETLKILAKNFN
ncbi:MAG: O-succinylbenzoic acid--CoA ligase [Lutibacter sp.]|nr:MAG: O-succinylbenzoic acid--CoA ligase [Lutibacter sp.]